MALTPKQKIFADEYLIDLNATRAYKVAYPRTKSDNAAAVGGSDTLRNPKVAAYIQDRMDARARRTEITQDRVLQEYARIAFFDPRKLFDDEGVPLEIIKLDDDTAAAIAGLEVNDLYEGFGEKRRPIGEIKKYKIADKKGALDSLARHLGMFNDRIQVSGRLETSKLDDVINQLRGEPDG